MELRDSLFYKAANTNHYPVYMYIYIYGKEKKERKKETKKGCSGEDQPTRKTPDPTNTIVVYLHWVVIDIYNSIGSRYARSALY